MLPSSLTAESFARYPPEARALADSNLQLLRALPLALVGLLLRETATYDWKFPAERREIDIQFRYLGSLSALKLSETMAGFALLRMPSDLSETDWVNSSAIFAQKFSAMLWATDQIGQFRAASIQYVNQYRAAFPEDAPIATRLTLVAIGSGAGKVDGQLFSHLRPHGTYYTSLKVTGGAHDLLQILEARGKAHPLAFAHWYIEGGSPLETPTGLITAISYNALNPVRLAVLSQLQARGHEARGPEALQTALGEMRPEQFWAQGLSGNSILSRFQLSLFTEGSGTQIFSTTFVQWASREVLRRAQPLTTVVRYAPRQIQRSMDELLADQGEVPTLDPDGALVDADMGAYYIWLNQRRLPDNERAAFLVWFEGHSEALLVAPGIAKGAVSHDAVTLVQLLAKFSESSGTPRAAV